MNYNISGPFAVDTGSAYKNVNQYVSWYLTLKLRQYYENFNNVFKGYKTLRSRNCTVKVGVVNPCSNEMYKKYYLILSFKCVLLQFTASAAQTTID
jgi:hypothetical protein